MANPHFAKFADVWKHLPLLEVLRIEQPRRYWETHAGSAFYPLTPSAYRSFGAYWFLDHAAESEALEMSVYRELLMKLAHADGYPMRYPGSAMFAVLALGQRADEYMLCDRDPESIADLIRATEALGRDRVRCVADDGPETVWKAYLDLPADEVGSVLCHLDPFDSFAAQPGAPSPIELFQRLALGGVTAVYWYAYEDTDERGWLLSQLVETFPTWCGDMLLPERDESGLLGCGVALANASERSIARCFEVGSAIESIYAGARTPLGDVGSPSFAAITR